MILACFFTCRTSDDSAAQFCLALNMGWHMQIFGAYILVIPTVASQSVLCRDSPIFQGQKQDLNNKEKTMVFDQTNTVCHVHVLNSICQLTMPRIFKFQILWHL